MSEFMETAVAVEPIIKMLDDGKCKYPYAKIFEDGSGSIIVRYEDRDMAGSLLVAHGVSLEGYQCVVDEDAYKFSIDRAMLKNYSETLCPHCGKDTDVLL